MPDIDELTIQINAESQKANDALDKLIVKLDRLTTSLASVDGSKLNGLASGVSQLGTAMQTMNGVKTADFTRLAKNLTTLNNLDSSKLGSLSVNVASIGQSLSGLSGVSEGAKQLSELANGIKQLGYKSAGQAIQNIPQLATAMKQLMAELSNAPTVNRNLIDMTNALAKLARTGSSAGRAATSLSQSLTGYSASTKTAKTHSFSLASAIGKVYATYWLLFRAIGKVKESIDISSQLTEVQNVVDVTFGEYSSLVDKMADTSIVDFGMSELTVKQISSRFQAMGTAIGFSQGKMADMSIELTKLTADMASFYDVEQDAVAKSLQSIFTGETEPLRKYGLDLTNATLQEYANKKGIDAKVKSMTQAEKTLLRYQYVMDNTGAAQGDFTRTANTWANQVRILKQNLEALATVIGGTFTNALKPMVSALNAAMSYIIAFAETVSNALGKIFGWKYEAGGGGVTNDLETGADAADDIASGIGDAADSAKKLKDYTLGIDELNVLSPDDSSSSSGGSGSGDSSFGGVSADGGQWVKDESLLDYESSLNNLRELGEYVGQSLTNALNSIPWDSVYEKARNFGTGLADFLNGLISPELFGEVAQTIAGALNTAVYTVLSFGQEFDFYNFGVSLATEINEFFDTFDFEALAETINIWVDGLKESIAGFLDTLTWEKILETADSFLGALELDTVEVLIGAFVLKNSAESIAQLLLVALGGKLSVIGVDLLLAFKSIALNPMNLPALQVVGNQIVDGIDRFIEKHFGEEVLNALGHGLLIAEGTAIGFFVGGPVGAIAGGIISGIIDVFANTEWGVEVWQKIKDTLFNFDVSSDLLETSKTFFDNAFSADNFLEFGSNIIAGIASGFTAGMTFFAEPIVDLFNWIVGKICDAFGIHSPAKEMEPLGKNILLGIVEGFSGAIGEFTSKASEFLENHVKPLFSGETWGEAASGILEGIQTKWQSVTTWFGDNVKAPLSGKFSELNEKISNDFESASNTTHSIWKPVSGWFNSNIITPLVTNFTTMKTNVSRIFTTLWSAIQNVWNAVSAWFNTTVITPVANLFEGFKTNISNIFVTLWATIQTVWSAVSAWFANTVITPVQTAFGLATTAIGNTFSKLWDGIKSGALSAMNAVIAVVEGAVNGIIDMLNTLHWEIPEWVPAIGGSSFGFNISHISLPKLEIPKYEIGGFPEDGLFMANHTELVGQFSNGKTAVANNEQIISGIQRGVYEANSEQNGLIQEMIELLKDIREKDTTIKMGSREVGKSLSAASRRSGYKLGTAY